MKIFKQICSLFGVFAVAAVMALLGSSSVFADEKQAEQRIQISPAIQDIGELKPGEKITETFKVQNIGTKTFNFKVGVSPYSVTDENYTQDYTNTNQYTDIVNWIGFSQTEGTIEPNGEVEIAYTITVPADVPAGGQYALIHAEVTPGETSGDGAGIATVQRVGMKLYTNVQGNTRKTGSIIENKVPSFMFNPPISATSIVENTGNTHTPAKYILQVFPFFGGEEVYTNEENPDTLTILPETRRLNTITWPNSPQLGLFRVKQTVTIFDETSVTEKIVFICPIWFLFIVLLIIFCVVFWIISRIRNRNRY